MMVRAKTPPEGTVKSYLSAILLVFNLFAVVAGYVKSSQKAEDVSQQLTFRIDTIEAATRDRDTATRDRDRIAQADHDLLNAVHQDVKWLVKKQGGAPRVVSGGVGEPGDP